MTLTNEQLNAVANSFFELLSDLDPLADPAVEQALNNAVRALDQLCLVTHAQADHADFEA